MQERWPWHFVQYQRLMINFTLIQGPIKAPPDVEFAGPQRQFFN
jgi:hypothetical protein